MSSLSGHAKLTAAAVRELGQENKSNPLAQGLAAAGLPAAAVIRDILDVLTLGHWADFAQKHHFMRKFDSQSPYQAYETAVEWIRSNALTAARIIAARLPRRGSAPVNGRQVFSGINWRQPLGNADLGDPFRDFERMRSPAAANSDGLPVNGRQVFSGIDWQPLGNAVHALEDSFAAGHVERSASTGSGSPGTIKHIKRYTGSEKHHHEEGDDAWQADSGGFSTEGRLAIEAVKALFRVVLATAQAGPNPTALVGWQGFRDKWLKADASLSKAKDRVFELIDRYSTGVRLGATNVKTLNMDEDGLAKALMAEDATTTLAVFERLDTEYNSDADDVAEIYVNLVQQQGGAKVTALKANKPLVARLIKVLAGSTGAGVDEGWTTSGEKKCIEFLRKL